MSQIELRQISKNFNGKTALKNISLKVEPGDILVIIGPNGSGKTTMLRIIDLLDEATSGHLYFDGVEIRTMHERLQYVRRIGMIFQTPTMFKGTVYSNVAYSLKIRGLSRDFIDERVKGILEFLGLTKLSGQDATTLSGGEAQRTAFARVLAYEPEVLLLDEPTANLDPFNAKIIENAIKKMNEERKITIIMSTHNLFQARRLAGKVGLLYSGELLELEDSETLFQHPRHELAAAFLRGDNYY